MLMCVCRLLSCLITEGGRASESSALRSNPSRLRKLDLSCNRLRQAGAHRLSAELEGLHWSLDVLMLFQHSVRWEPKKLVLVLEVSKVSISTETPIARITANRLVKDFTASHESFSSF